jgi:hypothetical protein
MRIARPPEGFKIILSDGVKKTIDATRPGAPRFDEIWDGVCERLKFTAHREGEPLQHGVRIWQIDGDPAFGIPRIAIIYLVLGDAVTVQRLLVTVS